ncbi:MAG: YbjN domain-containing protein [Bacteroidales bacterium]|nr:YbjN domain-containing protein [Bacteroidales bacterium]
MENYFQKLKNYLLEMEISIVSESEEDNIFVIENENDGISNMLIAIADPIVIIEQNLFKVAKDDGEMYKKLLTKNRDIIHGAFVLDGAGNVLFRDTLQVENLDMNELEGSLNSLTLLLSEFSNELIQFSHA